MTRKFEAITVGEYQIILDTSTKHGRTYYKNYISNIDDVDIAIAKKFMRSGDRVLDLGANIGYNAIHYLKLGAAHIDAVEPHPDLNAILRSFESNRFTVHPVAIGAAPGRAQLTISQTHNQGHTLKPEVVSLHRHVFGENLLSIEVDIATIDLLFPETRFDYIKVDIEGSELEFLEGARNLLAERPPRVLQIEIMPEFYSEYSYQLLQHFSNILRIDYDRDTGQIDSVIPTTLPKNNYKNLPPNYILFNQF